MPNVVGEKTGLGETFDRSGVKRWWPKSDREARCGVLAPHTHHSRRISYLPPLPGYLPVDSRGVAGLLALEWCLNNWGKLMEKRARVQEMRVKSDREILPIFDDPLRPVLGHPREVEAMKPLEGVLNDLMRG